MTTNEETLKKTLDKFVKEYKELLAKYPMISIEINNEGDSPIACCYKFDEAGLVADWVTQDIPTYIDILQ